MTRILVAEDSRAQAAQFKAWLEESSYEVSVVDNGVEALNAIGEVRPDVVVTDLQMPEMDGLELVDRIRFQYSEIPIILITAHGSEDLAVEALARGAAAYVPKSKIGTALVPTVEQVLGLIRADRGYAGLLRCLTGNAFTFELTNDPGLIGPLGDLMQQMFRALELGDSIERVRMGMAVEHALLNALFRGNLEISAGGLSDSEAMSAEDHPLVVERRSQSPYADRRTFFASQMTTAEARFVIRDEGPGFDTSLLPPPGDPDALEREGGRGLILMRSFMDEVTFNEQGNEVTLVKQFQ
jgi:CheY-like chemotaxis protein